MASPIARAIGKGVRVLLVQLLLLLLCQDLLLMLRTLNRVDREGALPEVGVVVVVKRKQVHRLFQIGV